MKKFIKSFLYIVAVGLLVTSCKKDLTVLTLDTSSPKSPKLTSTESKIVLLEARDANTAIVFNWTRPAYNFKGSFKFTLQFAMAGTNFASPVNESAGTDLTKAYTEKAFNALILGLGIAPNTAGNVEARIKAVLNDSVPALYSNIQSIVVTPYPTDQFIFVPGDYQGWNPAAAEILRSVNKNKKFEGYIYFAGGSGEFKFTDVPNWNGGIFGDATTGTSGTVASPGNNFKVTPPGYYKINADLNANTWSASKITWSVIGSAPPGTAWANDQQLTYDAAKKTWSVTLHMTTGEFKFRANNDWAVNLGDDGANGSLEYNGANIAVAAGDYTITLDLHTAGRYTYTIK